MDAVSSGDPTRTSGDDGPVTGLDLELERRLIAATDDGGGPDGRALLTALRTATVGGKRFRPWLVTATHAGAGGAHPDAVPAVASAVELLHTAFVVHDDVIDGDDVRRGRPTAAAWFRGEATPTAVSPAAATSYGVAGALLSGDLALAAAVRAVATAPAPPEVTGRMLDLVEQALAVTASGELGDVRLATHRVEPTLAEVLTVEERKTAVYSFALPMQLGLVLAGADEAQVVAAGEVGRHLGLAFQLQDDLLGVFGDPAVTGKSRTCDIREGKCTALMVHARTTEAWAVVAPHVGDPELSEDDCDRVRQALEDSGSRAFVESLVVDYLEAALATGRAAGLPAALLTELVGLCRLELAGAA